MRSHAPRIWHSLRVPLSSPTSTRGCIRCSSSRLQLNTQCWLAQPVAAMIATTATTPIALRCRFTRYQWAQYADGAYRCGRSGPARQDRIGVWSLTATSGQINQRATASALASCSAGDEDICRKTCAQTRDPQICDTWFAIKCPEDPSICQSACHLAHNRVACRGACEAGDQAACIDYFQMAQ